MVIADHRHQKTGRAYLMITHTTTTRRLTYGAWQIFLVLFEDLCRWEEVRVHSVEVLVPT